MPPWSVWKASVFVDKNRFFRSAARISRELRWGPKAGRVFVDENGLFRFAVRILRVSREKSVSGWLLCVFLEKKACLDGRIADFWRKKRAWMAGLRIFREKSVSGWQVCVFLENRVGPLKAGRVFVDENSVFRFAVRMLCISRENSVSG